MALQPNISEKYFPALAKGIEDLRFEEPLFIFQNDILKVVYAPFDHIETKAKVVIVGITPGLTQATNAITSAQKALQSGRSMNDALRSAKASSSFSGPMRSNLTAMLDTIGVNRLSEVHSTEELFSADRNDVHFTSALRYPVFVSDKNYNGTPSMLETPILRKMIETHLQEEAEKLPNAIWLPLGPKAEIALLHLSNRGALRRSHILQGMPHPSGANAERVAVFVGRKDPNTASNKTNSHKLLAARTSLKKQIANLEGLI